MWHLCSLYLFIISPSSSFSASGGLCFVIVAFPEHLHFFRGHKIELAVSIS